MSGPLLQKAEAEQLIAGLDSLIEGERVAAMLVALGEQAIPHLAHFLLKSPARIISLPRCRAVHALGELGAYSTLLSYLRDFRPSADAAVLFAEDAVRSAAAEELRRWRSDEVYSVLLAAAKQRATSGLVLALGEFCRTESVPLLFIELEDDLCREEAKAALRKIPEATHQYAVLLIRGRTDISLRGPSALRRRRATLQLLADFGIAAKEWPDVKEFLHEDDAGVVIAASRIGFASGLEQDQASIVHALFRVSEHVNFAEEDEVTTLLDLHRDIALPIAHDIVAERKARSEQPEWLKPSWRILGHILGGKLENYGAA